MIRASRRRPEGIAVVGVCGSGKSTLVEGLLSAGYTAWACAQEHSYVPYLWSRRNPDCLIYLDASLATVKKRLEVSWGEAYLADQRKRLANARTACYIYVNTDQLTAEEVLQTVLQRLERWPDG